MTIVGGGGKRVDIAGVEQENPLPVLVFIFIFPFFALLTVSGRDGGIISFFPPCVREQLASGLD